MIEEFVTRSPHAGSHGFLVIFFSAQMNLHLPDILCRWSLQPPRVHDPTLPQILLFYFVAH